MMAEAEARMGEARREVHRHIGDLPCSGQAFIPRPWAMPPRPRPSSSGDRFVDYCTHGKRAYHIASTIPVVEEPAADVLERLSEEFELCASGSAKRAKSGNAATATAAVNWW